MAFHAPCLTAFIGFSQKLKLTDLKIFTLSRSSNTSDGKICKYNDDGYDDYEAEFVKELKYAFTPWSVQYDMIVSPL